MSGEHRDRYGITLEPEMAENSRKMSTNDSSNYFSIYDILATQQKLPCTIEMTLLRLGYLDTSTEGEDLQTGTKLDLPFWMATAICDDKCHIASVEVPKQYKERYREILKADATVVDLHKLGPYYYAHGSKMMKFKLPESGDIARSLLQAFQARLRKIMDNSQNSYNEDTSKLTDKLDEIERHLFKAGQTGLNDFQKWETGQSEKLTTSEMVRHHRKRKRVTEEDP